MHRVFHPVALPSLGEKDQIVPEHGVRAIFSRLPGPGRVISYPEGWHMLFRDCQAPAVWTDVADWTLSLSSLGQ